MKKGNKTIDLVQVLEGHISVEELREVFFYRDGFLHYRKNKKRDRSNSRIDNLRLLNPKENSQNRQNANKNSLSGFVGVSAVGNRYRARINHEGKTIHIGFYANPVEAHNAYNEYKRILHKGYHHE